MSRPPARAAGAGLADLHIHSLYSDGTLTPEEILALAAAAGVSHLAITDHDTLEGARRLAQLPIPDGLALFTGVELDALEDGLNYHILGYGVCLDDEAFACFVREEGELLEEVNRQLIQKLSADDARITLPDYDAFTYDRRLGGWKALHYFIHKGLTRSLQEGFGVYARYHHTYRCVPFPGVAAVCRAIHQAGGKAILAHPGRVIPAAELYRVLEQLCSLGLDGLECYYPSHGEWVTEACLSYCRAHGLLITAGSDCHGSFEATQIGDPCVRADQLVLGFSSIDKS